MNFWSPGVRSWENPTAFYCNMPAAAAAARGDSLDRNGPSYARTRRAARGRRKVPTESSEWVHEFLNWSRRAPQQRARKKKLFHWGFVDFTWESRSPCGWMHKQLCRRNNCKIRARSEEIWPRRHDAAGFFSNWTPGLGQSVMLKSIHNCSSMVNI